MKTLTEKRDAIIKIAEQLFNQYGFKNIPVDELCRQGGLSKKTFYLCFKDKNELVTRVVEDNVNRLKSELDFSAIMAENAIDGFMGQKKVLLSLLSLKLLLCLNLLKGFPEAARTIKRFHAPYFKGFLVDNLQKGRLEGLYRHSLEPEAIASIYLFQVESIMTNSPNQLAALEAAMDIFLRGITTAKGITMLSAYGYH